MEIDELNDSCWTDEKVEGLRTVGGEACLVWLRVLPDGGGRSLHHTKRRRLPSSRDAVLFFDEVTLTQNMVRQEPWFGEAAEVL